jgi:hypothetical protein
MTDQMKNTNKRRRSFFWQRKRCLTAELSQSAIAAEEPLQDQQQDAQPWYRPGLLKVAVAAIAVLAILPSRAHGQFGLDTAENPLPRTGMGQIDRRSTTAFAIHIRAKHIEELKVTAAPTQSHDFH